MRLHWRLTLAAATALCTLPLATAMAAPSGWLALDGSIRATGAARDWGGSGSATAGCPAGAVDVGGGAGLFNCGAPSTGGAPPSAPALTAAAAADPSIISAVFVVDPISSDTTSCGSGDPTVIAGGSKNGDPIASYTLTTQSVPAKDDIGNVYAVSHTRPDNGHPEVYFAAERLVNNGDSHIDFEFLQSQVTITSPCSGAFVGHRTEGDLLAAVDFTTGGTLAGVTLYQWHCAAEPGPQPGDGTVCDPAGSTPPQHYQPISLPSTLSFLVNSAPVPCGGWVCRDRITGNATTVAANDFLEGGIDLLSIPFTGCFNTFLPHTRTAQSFTAVLKDFTGPTPLHSCRTPAATSTDSAGGGTAAPGATVTDTAVFTSAAGFAPTGTATFFLCSPAQVSGGGCPTGGALIGMARPLAGGSATSDSTVVGAVGRYCWRAEYAPDAASQGVYSATTHTNGTSECFTVAVAPPPTPDPGLPATGTPPAPQPPDPRLLWLGALLLAAGAATAAAVTRRWR